MATGRREPPPPGKVSDTLHNSIFPHGLLKAALCFRKRKNKQSGLFSGAVTDARPGQAHLNSYSGALTSGLLLQLLFKTITTNCSYRCTVRSQQAALSPFLQCKHNHHPANSDFCSADSI